MCVIVPMTAFSCFDITGALRPGSGHFNKQST